jgi:hypothetical protein
MDTPTYGIINDQLWDLDLEEPVLILTDIDAEDDACIEQFLSQAVTSINPILVLAPDGEVVCYYDE